MTPFVHEDRCHTQHLDHPLTTRAGDLPGQGLERTTVESIGSLEGDLEAHDIIPGLFIDVRGPRRRALPCSPGRSSTCCHTVRSIAPTPAIGDGGEANLNGPPEQLSRLGSGPGGRIDIRGQQRQAPCRWLLNETRLARGKLRDIFHRGGRCRLLNLDDTLRGRCAPTQARDFHFALRRAQDRVPRRWWSPRASIGATWCTRCHRSPGYCDATLCHDCPYRGTLTTGARAVSALGSARRRGRRNREEQARETRECSPHTHG